ncbi:MBOAT family O-acyltransferase [Leptospira levettii]|uniref:MBOAT family O-acyltransferase n=1 Tax=Leptospira levettii TaxID=2023178 RepID=UPI001083BDAA|nr:MBOAT family O-acyltransferase [Leptospira levettii]TGK98723.1 MBOAT family protein [Leptospira levettii]TGL08821.1 MBOAT family protein [Leptospira levettii]TGM27514.1 MBOAT family protein [Leptospira levettii]
MLFNSIPFLIFFSFVYLFYWAIPKEYRKGFLLFAGICFYAYFSLALTVHFLVVITINYLLYRKIQSTPTRFWVGLTVSLNLINLGFFKYVYFFSKVLADLTSYPFFQQVPNLIHIALPLAISFYTFQVIAAAVDTYRNPNFPTVKVEDYFLFVAFFPVLIAGPIMRMSDFFPNLDKLTPSKEKMYRASYLMMSGLVKKVLVADPMSLTISPVFNSPSDYDSFSLFIAGICYSIQVFSDFSGLTDMARSVALYLGFETPENFKAPFFSTSGRELWKRWHITLSFWLRDYIYFPLGGSKKGELRTYLNLIIIMTLGGFWHGADYTFICWGFYWGVILAGERFLEGKLGLKLTPEKNKVLIVLKAMIVFVLFSISGLMFRSNNATNMLDHFYGIFTHFSHSLERLLDGSSNHWLVSATSLLGEGSSFKYLHIENLERIFYTSFAVLFFHHLQYFPEFWEKIRKHDVWLVPTLGIITIFLLATLSQDGGEFIYYRF